MTAIYLHIDARMADYIRTHPERAGVALLVAARRAWQRPASRSVTVPSRSPAPGCSRHPDERMWNESSILNHARLIDLAAHLMRARPNVFTRTRMCEGFLTHDAR